MTAAAKGSVSAPMLITKDEATAAQRTVLFHLVLTADQADAAGLVPVVTLSKAGAAFGAAVGPVTELANGWYKIVLDAADVNTLGQLAMHVAVALADSLDVVHQVIALDLNTATVNPGAGGIVAASFGAGAIDAAAIAADAIAAAELAPGAVAEIQSGLVTTAGLASLELVRNTFKTLTTITVDGSSEGISLAHARRAVLAVTGTWDGATATVQVCHDPSATVPVWQTYVDTLADNPLTADGEVVLVGPINAVRVTVSNDGATTELTPTLAIAS